MAYPEGVEPSLAVLETAVLPVTPGTYKNHSGSVGVFDRSSIKQRSKFLSEPHRPRILKDRAFCTRESVLSTLIRKSPAFKRGLMLAPFELFNSEYRSSDAFATDLQGISLYVSSGCKTAANLWQPNTLCKNQRIGTYNCYVQWCRDF